MRAWFYTRFGGPAVVQLGSQPDPELRDAHDVIVRVRAAGLNPIDYKRRQGALKLITKERWPEIVGYDVSGVVVSCGTSVTKFREGDEVFGMLPHDRMGALAELAVAHEKYFAKKPVNLTHAQAASLPLVSLTALNIFRQYKLEQGKKVLITAGAGGVGTMAIQIAKHVFKASSVATTASAKKADKLKQLGADEVVDYNKEKFERALVEYDFALDCTAEAKKCFECVRRGGTVVSIAETPSTRSLEGKEAYGLEFSSVVGFVLNCLSNSVTKAARRAQIEFEVFFVVGDGKALDEIRAFAEAETIIPVIDRVFTFDKAAEAMEYLEAGRATGKVVVEMTA